MTNLPTDLQNDLIEVFNKVREQKTGDKTGEEERTEISEEEIEPRNRCSYYDEYCLKCNYLL